MELIKSLPRQVRKTSSYVGLHWVSLYWSAFDRFEAWKL